MTKPYVRVLARRLERVNDLAFETAALNQGVIIPVHTLPCRHRSEISFVAKLACGLCFALETHEYEEQMVVLAGSGVFCCEGVLYTYAAGSLIIVSPGVPHRFVAVLDETVFVQHVPARYPAARSIRRVA